MVTQAQTAWMLPLWMALLAPIASGLTLTDVFVGGSEGYDCYRIPALVRYNETTYFAFAEGRKFSCNDHDWNDLVMKTSHDAGKTWSGVKVVYSESTPDKHVTIGNPAPVLLDDGKTLLMPFCRDNKHVLLINSTDGGETWSSVRDLSPGMVNTSWVATGPPGSIQLQSGRIILPLDYNTPDPAHSAVWYSDDRGLTWHWGGSVLNGNECQAVQLRNGTVLLNQRTTGSTRQVSLSDDEGQSFHTTIPTNHVTACEGSTTVITSSSGQELLVQSLPLAESRTNMTIQTSSDGVRWQSVIDVYPEDSAYSSLQPAAQADTVALLFEADHYKRISFTMAVVTRGIN